jgi:pyruvate/2-oxoglutarate dehydrogenase complex dihydrolipoamide dehydrogenase (E3) component
VIDEEGPDEVIVATGALPRWPDIPGIHSKQVVSSWDILNETAKVGKRVVISGGGMVGCETAEFLAERGHEIMIASQSTEVGKDIEQTIRRYLLKRLEEFGVEILTNTMTKEIQPDHIVLATFGKEWTVDCDNVILAKGAVPNRQLVNQLRDTYPKFYLIGDALEPRTAREAIYEGSRVAREI